MARRRNNSIVLMLVDLPWSVSVIVAGIVYIAMRWVIPSTVHSPMLIPLAKAISGFAALASIVFLFVAAISCIRNRKSSAPTIRLVNSISASNIPLNRDTRKVTVGSNKMPPPITWSLDLLRTLEWKRFELLAAEYFRVLGKRVETISHGADGGIDARVYANNSDVLEYAIQCKAWGSPVGVKEIRELFGVIVHESAGKGIFMTTRTFTDDAKKFASEHSNKLFLIDGQKFISMIGNLPEVKKAKLLAFVTEGDYTTPSCASCGTKMVSRSGKSGKFWGCQNYPKCKSTLKMATS